MKISTWSGIFSQECGVFRTCHLAIPGALKRKEKGWGDRELVAYNKCCFSRNPSYPECKNPRQRKQTPCVDKTGR